MARSQSDDETNNHTGKDGYNRLMNRPDAFYLEVIGREEREDEEYAHDEQRP